MLGSRKKSAKGVLPNAATIVRTATSKQKSFSYTNIWHMILIDGNIGKAGKKITLPLYMTMFLFED